MTQFMNDAKKLIKLIGGKNNISSFTHCATRLRVVLYDHNKVNKKLIETIPSIKSIFFSESEIHFIIGNSVSSFYQHFNSLASKAKEKNEKIAPLKHKNILQRGINILAEIFAPILPAIIVGGLILGFRNILEGIQFGHSTIVERSTFWNGINQFLWLLGEAIFHFLPIGVTWSVTKKMGTTQILGIVLGITLVSPQLLNAYSVSGTSATDIPFWDFGFAQVSKVGYQSQVIPAIMSGLLLSYLEKFFRKWIPEAISMIFVPLFSLLPAVFFAHIVLGPIGWKIGSGISHIVNTGLTSDFSWIFGGIFGAFYSSLVIPGLHHTTLAIDAQLIADFQSTNLWPMIALSNIAQGSAVLGIIFIHRNNQKEQQIAVPSLMSAWLGVTEPAMFGINLKHFYPFIAAMIGSGFAGMFTTIFGVRALSIGIGGLPSILAMRTQDYFTFIIGMSIAIGVPFILTIFFHKQKLFKKKSKTSSLLSNKTINEKLFSPGFGKIIPLKELEDPVFSKNIMGEGFALLPEKNEVFSPVCGIVKNIFKTKHAIIISTLNGYEILVHMGLDTVKLNGEPFTVRVNEGDNIDQNTIIAEMRLDAIISSGKKTDIIIVITNLTEKNRFLLEKTGFIQATDLVGKIQS